MAKDASLRAAGLLHGGAERRLLPLGRQRLCREKSQRLPFRARACAGEAPELAWGAEPMVCSRHRDRIEGWLTPALSIRAAAEVPVCGVPC